MNGWVNNFLHSDVEYFVKLICNRSFPSNRFYPEFHIGIELFMYNRNTYKCTRRTWICILNKYVVECRVTRAFEIICGIDNTNCVLLLLYLQGIKYHPLYNIFLFALELIRSYELNFQTLTRTLRLLEPRAQIIIRRCTALCTQA